MSSEQVNPMKEHAEVTLCLLKPHVVWAGLDVEIRQVLERNRFGHMGTLRLVLTEESTKHMLSLMGEDLPSERHIQSFVGQCTAYVLTKKNAISDLRKLAGHDVPDKAHLGTLRRMYGMDSCFNACLVPKNEEQYTQMFGVIDAWSKALMHALNDTETDALEKAEELFKKIIAGQGIEEDEDGGFVVPEETETDPAPEPPEVEPAVELGDDRENPFAK